MGYDSFKNLQKLEDHWASIAPFGLTKDGEVAPGHAFDHNGEPIDASQWNEEDFYTKSGELIVAHITNLCALEIGQ